jgi:ABC-type Fe3+ transport system permease subunit
LVRNHLRRLFLGRPRGLVEAARVGGASYLQLFRKIALAASVIATVPMLIIFSLGQPTCGGDRDHRPEGLTG